jgi:hypothetical protein
LNKVASKFEVMKDFSSPTNAVQCYNGERSSYTMGSSENPNSGDIGYNGCGWNSSNTLYNLAFQGKDENSKSLQEYQFGVSSAVDGSKISAWNITAGADSVSISNRAIGQAILSGSQTSNSKNATPLNQDSSYLLGLQALAPAVNWVGNKDSNTNRPQLNTSFRRVDDDFGGVISADDKSINGRIARTGIYNKIHLKLLIYRFF